LHAACSHWFYWRGLVGLHGFYVFSHFELGGPSGSRFSLRSGVSRARTRGNEIGGGFLLPAFNRQGLGPAGFGLGVGSVLRIVIAYFSGSILSQKLA
jgi:hypothetical protein